MSAKLLKKSNIYDGYCPICGRAGCGGRCVNKRAAADFTITQEGSITGGETVDFYAMRGGETLGVLTLDIPANHEDDAGFYLDPSDTDYGISNIEVYPDYRKQGVAKALIAHAEQVIGRKLGYNTAPTAEGRAMNNALGIHRASSEDEIGTGAEAVTTHGKFYGSAAAGCIFVARDTGRALVAHRSEDVNEPHTWGVWGGAIEAGEDPAEAAKREAGEEAGYHEAMELEQIHVYNNGDFHYTTFIAWVPTEFTPVLNWENDAYQWCERGEWPTPLHYGLRDTASIVDAKRPTKTAKQAADAKLPKYVYHSTFLRNLEDITMEGLKPSGGSQFNGGYDFHSKGRIFFSDWEGVTFWSGKMEDIANHNSDFTSEEDFGWSPIVLRMDTDYIMDDEMEEDELGFNDSGFNHSWFTTEPIEPECLEVWTGLSWVSLDAADYEDMLQRAVEAATFVPDDDEPSEDEDSWQDEERSGYYDPEMNVFKPKTAKDKLARPDQIDSPAFKAWFSGSKIVDDKGNPMRCFHGTDSKFEAFKAPNQRFEGGSISNLYSYVTTDPDYAHNFGGSILPLYAKARNPLDLRQSASAWVSREDFAQLLQSKGVTVPDLGSKRGDWIFGWVKIPGFKDAAKAAGYDAIWLEESNELGQGSAGRGDALLLFNPNQLKSALANSGEFNPDNDNLTASLEKSADRKQINLEWMEKVRKDFLMLMKNVPLVKNYKDAEALGRNFAMFRNNFENVFFEQFLNRDLKYKSGLSAADAERLDREVRAIGWTFSSELRLPLRDHDEYWSKEQCYAQFEKKVTTWETGLRKKAQAFWKAMKWVTEIGILPAEGYPVDVPDVETVELEGFQCVVKSFQDKDRPKMDLIKAGLKLFRESAQERLPILLDFMLPLEIEFETSIDKGGEYLGRTIVIFASAVGDPKKVVHFVAHEMGHHIWNTLSEDAQDFWRAAIRADYGDLDIQTLLDEWPKDRVNDDAWAFQFTKIMAETDPILGLQVAALSHNPSYRQLEQKRDFQALLDSGETTLKVPKHPITDYANKNPNEAFCEAIGMTVGYGPRAVLPEVRNWLEIILPKSAKRAGMRTAATEGQIHGIVRKYLAVLPPGTPMPNVKVVNTPTSSWLGICRFKYGEDNCTIELQKTVLGDDATIERIIAHELCHHAEFMASAALAREKGWNKETHARMDKLMHRSHGPNFRAWAAKFNAIYGADFVTEESDSAMVKGESSKDINVLLWKKTDTKVYWAFTIRPSAKQKEYIKAKLGEPGYRYVSTRDIDFAQGTTIGKSWSYSFDDGLNSKLTKLWDEGKDVKVAGSRLLRRAGGEGAPEFLNHLFDANTAHELGFYFEEGGCYGMALALFATLKPMDPGCRLLIGKDFAHAYVKAFGKVWDSHGECMSHPCESFSTREAFTAHVLETSGWNEEELQGAEQTALDVIETAKDFAKEGSHKTASGFSFKPKRLYPSEVVVSVDVAKVDASWAKDTGFYVGPGGTGSAIGNRYANFQKWVQDNPGTAIWCPDIGINHSTTKDLETGIINFTDGRHRWAVLRDMGAKRMDVIIPKAELSYFEKRFDGKLVQGGPGPKGGSKLLREAATTDVAPLVKEFMDFLDPEHKCSMPPTKVVNRVNVQWLGICTPTGWNVNAEGIVDAYTSEIMIQKGALADTEVGRRVVAHEVAHHVADSGRVLGLPEDEASKNSWAKGDGHDPVWQRLADKLNAHYGEGFVTVVSDASLNAYEKKEVYLFAVKTPDFYAWCWATTVPKKLVDKMLSTKDDTLAAFIGKTTNRYLVVPEAKGTFRVTRTKEQREAIEEALAGPGNIFDRYAKTGAKKPAVDVNSEAFQRWFGNSKIVDDQGNPLPVFHGTPTGGFDVFESAGKRDTGWTGRGFYFTKDKELAKSFTSGRSSDNSGRPKKQVYAVFLKALNPIHIMSMDPEWAGKCVQEMRESTGRPPLSPEKLEDYMSEYAATYATGNQVAIARDLKHLGDPGYMAKFMGHDAVLADFEGGSIMVFEPTQIKSATNNAGTFDPNNPSINASKTAARDMDLDAKPWEMTEEEFKANPPRGYIYKEKGHGTEEGSNTPEGIILTHRFWGLPVETRKHVVMHEIGHDLSDKMLADGSAWEIVDTIFPKSKWQHVNGQTTPGEAWAELYALWADDPAHLQNFPGAEELLVQKVFQYGLPVFT